MAIPFFEPLFRLKLLRNIPEYEGETRRLLAERADWSPVEKKLLDVFLYDCQTNAELNLTEESLAFLRGAKEFFLQNECYEGAFLCARLMYAYYLNIGIFSIAQDLIEECLRYNAHMDEKYFSDTYVSLIANYRSGIDNGSMSIDEMPECGKLAVEKAGSDPVFLTQAYRYYGHELTLKKRWDELFMNAKAMEQLVEQQELTGADCSATSVFVCELFYEYYMGVGDHESALEYARRGLALNLDSGNEYNIYASYESVGKALALGGRYDEAIEMAQKVYDYGKGNDMTLHYILGCQDLIEYALGQIGRQDILRITDERIGLIETVYREKYKTEFVKKTSDIMVESLEKEREYEKRANQMKSDFLANMSHEIRTPMNAISGMAELILRCESIGQAREYASSIKSASKSLLTIINDILDFSKIESGKLEIIPEVYQPSSVLNDLANMALVRIGDKPVAFAVEADRQLPHELYGDETRIKQILINFLNNAIKFTKSGTITLRMSCVSLGEDTVRLCASVADTGIGIRKEDLPKLFSSFSQLETRRNRAIEGTGLGLAISKRLAELMEGDVSVESEYGKGSTFTVILPQKIVDAQPMGEFAQAEGKRVTDAFVGGFIAPASRILVVDDNEVNLTVAKGLLAPYRMNVSTASSAAECFEMLKDRRFDIIFMDHMMPVMDGVEAVSILRKTDSKTPIIALTANAISGVREMYLKSGFTGYLSKPIDVREMDAILAEHLPKDHIIKSVRQGLDSAALTGDIRRTILAEGQKKLPLLKKLFTQRDLKNYAIEVHALKSVAAMAKQNELAGLAKAHEAAGKAGDGQTIEESFDRLIGLYGQWLDSLAQLAPAQDPFAAEKVSLPQKDIDRLFTGIRECAVEFDIDGINEALGKLKDAILTADECRRLQTLENAAELLDYSAILAAAGEGL